MVSKIDTVMEHAIYALREMSNDTVARQMAEMREAHLHDEASALQSARDEGYSQGRDEGYSQGRDEGYSQGRDEGYSQGRDEGYSQGRDEGYSQGQQNLIEKMRVSGMTDEQINAILSI